MQLNKMVQNFEHEFFFPFVGFSYLKIKRAMTNALFVWKVELNLFVQIVLEKVYSTYLDFEKYMVAVKE